MHSKLPYFFQFLTDLGCVDIEKGEFEFREPHDS